MLNEDADMDVSISLEINRFRMELIRYLLKRKKDNKYYLPDKIDYKGVKLEAICAFRFAKSSNLFHDLVLAYHPTFPYAGMATPLKKPQDDIRYTVIFRADSLDHFYSLIWDRNYSTFRHEMVHVCDFKRYKGNKISGTSDLVKGDDFTDYANNPLESNAFFHEIAEQLLDGLRFMKEQPEVATELLVPPAGPFQYWLEMRVLQLPRAVRQIYKSFTPQLKRRVISRLKALWDSYWKEWQRLDKFDTNNA